MKNMINKQSLEQFAGHLRQEEKSKGTVENYLRDAARFVASIEDSEELTREDVAAWRDSLTAEGYAACSVNRMVAAVNALLRFLGLESLCVKSLRLQRRAFRDQSKELTQEEYERLLEAAKDNPRLYLLLETIAGVGIRVGEVRYITVEAARAGRADISLKGKVRTILLPAKLCRKLLKYARKNKIASGAIFRTRNGKPLSRRQIWAEMKALCGKAGVEKSKVFPHNLRHLFARLFYKVTHDIVKLSDVLGHSSIETTRVYLISTGEEHARVLERLGLVS